MEIESFTHPIIKKIFWVIPRMLIIEWECFIRKADGTTNLYIYTVWSTPLKNMEVSWDGEISNIWKMFQKTNQYISYIIYSIHKSGYRIAVFRTLLTTFFFATYLPVITKTIVIVKI